VKEATLFIWPRHSSLPFENGWRTRHQLSGGYQPGETSPTSAKSAGQKRYVLRTHSHLECRRRPVYGAIIYSIPLKDDPYFVQDRDYVVQCLTGLIERPDARTGEAQNAG